MSDDAGRFATEIDDRIEGYLQEVRDRAAAAKRDIDAGVLALVAKAAPPAPQPPPPPAPKPASPGASPFDDLVPAPDPALGDLDIFAEPANGAHPLDAPIFGESDSFLTDDLDFSIDLDNQHPA